MQQLQDVFLRIQENKKKMKDLRSSYKDALATSKQYMELKEEIATMREKLKDVEAGIRSGFASEFMQIEDLKIDIKSDEELMSDIAVTQIMKGETVELKGKDDEEYDPIVSVKFKKR